MLHLGHPAPDSIEIAHHIIITTNINNKNLVNSFLSIIQSFASCNPLIYLLSLFSSVQRLPRLRAKPPTACPADGGQSPKPLPVRDPLPSGPVLSRFGILCSQTNGHLTPFSMISYTLTARSLAFTIVCTKAVLQIFLYVRTFLNHFYLLQSLSKSYRILDISSGSMESPFDVAHYSRI